MMTRSKVFANFVDLFDNRVSEWVLSHLAIPRVCTL